MAAIQSLVACSCSCLDQQVLQYVAPEGREAGRLDAFLPQARLPARRPAHQGQGGYGGLG